MFVYYHGTKADFINKNLDTYYKEKKSIVFIKGGSEGTGECIFTRGNFFANFKDLIDTLIYVKGVAVKITNPETGEQEWSLLNSAVGGGYLAITSSNTKEIVVGVNSSGIEISLSKDFVSQIEEIIKDLSGLKSRIGDLEEKLDPNIEGSIGKRVQLLENQIDNLVKDASEGFNTLAKTEAKIKALLKKIKPVEDQPISIDFEEDENDIISVNLSINVDDTSIQVVDKKLSVKNVDGGTYL